MPSDPATTTTSDTSDTSGAPDATDTSRVTDATDATDTSRVTDATDCADTTNRVPDEPSALAALTRKPDRGGDRATLDDVLDWNGSAHSRR